jgi:hypothetical protein
LRPVDVSVLRAPCSADDCRHVDGRHKLADLARCHRLRRHSLFVLHPHGLGEPFELRCGFGNEEVAAPVESKRDLGLEAFGRLGVEGSRLAREPAIDARRPLLPNAARLDAGRARADPGALENADGGASRFHLTRDRKADDPGADHGHVEFRRCPHRRKLTRERFAFARLRDYGPLMFTFPDVTLPTVPPGL